MKKKIVVLTGAGVSAESGFATFRDSGGLWERYPVEKVATPEGWYENPEFVNEFYNGLRHQLVNAQPNEAHYLLAELEKDYDVTIVTQNVDNLHERAGSTDIIYLHGELMKACSSNNPDDSRYIRTLDTGHLDILPGEKAGDGSLLRPYIVWFSEPVPNIEAAANVCQQADIFIIIGTSMRAQSFRLCSMIPKLLICLTMESSPCAVSSEISSSLNFVRVMEIYWRVLL